MNAEMRVKIETVCSLPPGCGADAVTSDGHVFAFCPMEDGRLQFLWDGSPGAPFDGLSELRDKSAPIYPSDDGAHFAYLGIRGDKQFVGRDGTEDQPFEGLSRSVPPTFGGGGRHLAYGALVAGGDYRLIVDGVPVGTNTLAPTAAVFSPDGERFAYMEMRGEDRSRTECRIVLDGQPGDWFAGTRNAPGAMQFSPDGGRFAYYAIDGEGNVRWIVDGVPQRLFNEVVTLSLARIRGVGVLEADPLPAGFSPDGQRFAYFADVAEKGVAIVEDDAPGPVFKAVRAPVFSPDSRHLAYVAHTYRKTIAVVLDGVVIAEWNATRSGEPVFSADSRHVAVPLGRESGGLLHKHKLHTVAVDDRMFPEERADDASLSPTFSPDGAHVAWWLQRGTDGLLVIDGMVQDGAPAVVSDFRFDAAGRTVYGGSVGTSQAVVVGGRPGPLSDAIVNLVTAKEAYGHGRPLAASVPFRFSPAGTHVAWAGWFDDQICPVFDDEVGPGFDLIHACGFDEDGSAVWWAQREQEVVRVTRMS